jgi:hypothetical protein
MTQLVRIHSVIAAMSLSVAVATSATAQTTGQSTGTPDARQSIAGTSVTGDTGLWQVPTGNVLPVKKWTFSFARINEHDGQGFTNVSNFPLAFAFGVASHVEVFGSWTVLSRLDRDTNPLFFVSDPSAAKGTGGGLTVNYPYDRKSWVGDAQGDVRIGGKFSVTPNSAPVGFAVRPMVKFGVGSKTKGASTGQTDFEIDGILSRSMAKADITGYAGYLTRSNPSGYTLTNGLRYGIGAGLPMGSSRAVVFSLELYGEKYSDNTVTAPSGIVAPDGSIVPVVSSVNSPVYVGLGVTWRATSGFFLGIAGEWNLNVPPRNKAVILGTSGGFTNASSSDKGFEVRLGYRPGSGEKPAPVPRSKTPPPAPTPAPPPPAPAPTPAPPPPAPTPAPAPPPRANRPPSVTANCDPCTVEVGRTSTISADAQDPDGDPLTYQWTSPSGTLANARSRQTTWTAPLTTGPVRVTMSVDDGHGGVVTTSVTINVVAAGATTLKFE